jgi:hypothetical protein
VFNKTWSTLYAEVVTRVIVEFQWGNKSIWWITRVGALCVAWVEKKP